MPAFLVCYYNINDDRGGLHFQGLPPGGGTGGDGAQAKRDCKTGDHKSHLRPSLLSSPPLAAASPAPLSEAPVAGVMTNDLGRPYRFLAPACGTAPPTALQRTAARPWEGALLGLRNLQHQRDRAAFPVEIHLELLRTILGVQRVGGWPLDTVQPCPGKARSVYISLLERQGA